jgi:hypothetical protein
VSAALTAARREPDNFGRQSRFAAARLGVRSWNANLAATARAGSLLPGRSMRRDYLAEMAVHASLTAFPSSRVDWLNITSPSWLKTAILLR